MLYIVEALLHDVESLLASGSLRNGETICVT